LHGQLVHTFALCSQKAIHLLPGEYGEILGRLEVDREKVACWRKKAAISLKRVGLQIEEKLLWTQWSQLHYLNVLVGIQLVSSYR